MGICCMSFGCTTDVIMKKAISYILSADCLLGKLMLACIYALAYDFMYENFVYKLFSYIGNMDYVEMGMENRVLWILLSVLPFNQVVIFLFVVPLFVCVSAFYPRYICGV